MTQLATSILDANLEALSAASADAAARIRKAAPREDVKFFETEDGVPTAQIGDGLTARFLASRRRPREEASRLADAIELTDAAVYVVAGFGMGYHVAALSERLKRSGVIIVFEPDVGLLRAVLERVDCSEWVRAGNVCILTDPEDGAAMNDCLRGLEGLVGLGVTLVQHPPSTARLGSLTRGFHDRFTGIVESVKMTVITTLVQVRVTMRNLMQNADVYAATPGIADIAGACAGRPGIVVSAGPSLRRNVDLLKDPAVRERCVIVAVQTVLKPLLAAGVRPHFVTALDYSEINRRFYEGLTAADVEGVTLVVEPKVNPAVLMAWPGKVRCIGDATLDLLLGRELAHRSEKERLKQGATVAHLAYYLARHLGCDPVALVGQDLGFTDGQYYAAGASIHNVWAGELNEFKSLELMEWQRIVRMGAHLRAATDVLGRPMYTDSQMHSYLVQFESDFGEDEAKGLTTIDATEGGVRKQHAEPMALRRFLDAHAGGGGRSIDELLSKSAAGGGAEGRARDALLKKLHVRVGTVRAQVERVAEISRKTSALLTEMREHHADRERVDRLIDKVQRFGAEVEAISPGFQLTQLLGQATVFNRVRADRMIHLGDETDEHARQKLQIQRDIENVRGLGRTATELVGMLDGCLSVLGGGERVTRDLPKSEAEFERESRIARGEGLASDAPAARPAVVSAIVAVDLERSGLGRARRLDVPLAGRCSVLAATVDRLLLCEELREVVLVAADVGRTSALLEPRLIASGRVRVEQRAPGADERRRRAIQVGRAWASHCWRGGLADLTVFDEVFDPGECVRVLDQIGADAAMVVGADWSAVDPKLCDQIIRRHREEPRINRLTFTQAAPGLCGCVVGRSLAHDLSKDSGSGRLAFATIGGVLGYVPGAPLQDLIAHPICVGVPTSLRDCGLRVIVDSEFGRDVIDGALTADFAASGERIVAHAMEALPLVAADEWTIDLGVGRPIEVGELMGAIGAEARAVTLGVPGNDPLGHPAMFDLIAALASTGIVVQMRTPLHNADDLLLRRLLTSGVSVIGVDVGEKPTCSEAVGRIERLMALRREVVGDDGLGIPWIVPRLTRSDATCAAVEEFIDKWVMTCGWAALDALPEARENERIQPLPSPVSAAQRFARLRRVL